MLLACRVRVVLMALVWRLGEIQREIERVCARQRETVREKERANVRMRKRGRESTERTGVYVACV